VAVFVVTEYISCLRVYNHVLRLVDVMAPVPGGFYDILKRAK